MERADTFIFKVSKAFVRIYCDDVMFFESYGHYITIHMNDNTTHTMRFTLKEVENMTDKTKFVKVHRGFIVNIDYVESIGKSELCLKNAKGSIPVSRSCWEKLKEIYGEEM